ncbi:MAG: Rrf2 family transcriptional regulator [Magnetospirillum gryphiswaldense]|nr:Rrf2 family transcriptional regulator [Magnetospirillum gryphiswaldense]
MSQSCRFTVAVHTCALLGLETGHVVTSEWIAGSVNTNPVVIRRILSALNKAGLVTSVRGSNGGSLLAKAAQDITLLDIKRAVDSDDPVPLYNQPPNEKCPVARSMQPVLRRVIERAEAAREAVLSTTSLAEVIAAIPKV